MSYAFFKQVLPPTGVEHCLKSSFTAPDAVNLIVAKTSVLDVYTLRRGSETQPDYVLELVTTHSLFGNVESLVAVRFPGHARDAIILTFRDAKVSVLEFNPELNDLQVISLHCYEQDKLKEGHEYYGKPPQLRMDTQQRCAVMQIFDRKLVVLPFRQEASVLLEMEFGDSMEKQNKVVQDSFVIDPAALGLVNIKDFAFLHGYHEPTLLVLYEPIQTWVGRISSSKNTCVVSAVSLHLSAGGLGEDTSTSHPIIWSVEGLPWDSFALASVPAPIGGILVLSTNSIVYLNQSTRCGLALNMFADGEDSPVMLVPSKIPISLDTARFAFLADDQLLVSLKGGELYIFHLLTDGRAVQRIEITKAGTSVLSTCMCTLVKDGLDFLFLGSRLGDSLLIQYSESDQPMEEELFTAVPLGNSNSEKNDARQFKAEEQDEDPYAVTTSASKGHVLRSYKFKVCDSLLNIGPVADFAIGESLDSASVSMNEYESKRNIEFVTCSGYDKHGSLCVLQHGIRPELVHAAEELAGCNAVWTLHAGGRKGAEEHHDYLLLSKEDRTLVLATGEELEEISNEVDFNLGAATLEAGNVLTSTGQCRIVQVHQYGLILLHNGRAEKRISVADEIISASICDPFVLLLVAPSNLRLFHAINSVDSANLTELATLPPEATANTVAIHLFDGKSLVGSSTPNPMCAMVDSDGNFKIYTLPAFREVFCGIELCDGPGLVPNTLLHSSSLRSASEMSLPNGSKTKDSIQHFPPVEIALHTMNSSSDGLPYLFVFLSNDVLLVYRSFCVEALRSNSAPLPITFKRCRHDIITETFPQDDSLSANKEERELYEEEKEKELNDTTTESNLGELSEGRNTSEATLKDDKISKKRKREDFKEAKDQNDAGKRSRTLLPTAPDSDSVLRTPRRIFSFHNIGGRDGVFITGKHPLWAITHRGNLNLYEMRLDPYVICFTPFHNVKCPHGFIYFNQQGVLKICQLPSDILLEIPWAVRKIPLRCTPRHIAYHADAKSFALSVSNTIYHQDTHNSHGIPFTEERHELRLMSAGSWKVQDRYVLDEHEHLLSLKVVMLNDNYNQLSRRSKPYLIIGTASLEGEDAQCKGRVIIFEIEQSSLEDEETFALRHLYSKAMKGPVSAISALQNYLLLAIGPKLFLFNFDGISLEGVGFYDAQHYIVSLNTMKNFILAGDYRRALFFLRWKESGHSIKLVAKEHLPVGAMATEFVVDKQNLSFLLADERGNFTMYAYDPHALESRGGLNLLARGDFHVGARVNAILRLPMYLPSSDLVRHADWFATLDGGLGFLAPVDEAVFRRQAMLLNRLITDIPHCAGLNPASFRLLRAHALIRNPKRTILDGELLFRFLSLPLSRQSKLAAQLGTTRQRILNDQVAISESVFHPL